MAETLTGECQLLVNIRESARRQLNAPIASECRRHLANDSLTKARPTIDTFVYRLSEFCRDDRDCCGLRRLELALAREP